ncbi:MAG: Ldh family oxidoreductase [Burkholderiales bacterium]|nr:Ldh family oxidoreductase [Burkholderiales bacterium]
MQINIEDATALAVATLSRHGLSADHARQVADHLVEAAMCGHEFASLPRILAIVEELRAKASGATPIRVAREDGAFAHVDGGDNIAYVVSVFAVDKAVEIARRHGVGIVTANNTWFSGRCAHYVERGARAGFVTMHTTNTTARVAPYGGADRIMGTNPFAIAFPSSPDPLVVDIGTSSITWGDVVLCRTKGEPLPPQVAVDGAGEPTRDPQSALEGAFMPWGGARGSALSLAVQLLGVLAGSAPVVRGTADFGLFFLAVDPARIAPGRDFHAQVAELRRIVASSRPAAGGTRVRVPGDGSHSRRAEALRAGTINVDEKVYARLLELSR